jgi:hypothetical protein
MMMLVVVHTTLKVSYFSLDGRDSMFLWNVDTQPKYYTAEQNKQLYYFPEQNLPGYLCNGFSPVYESVEENFVDNSFGYEA